MPLDLAKVAAQVERMSASLKAGEDDREARLKSALGALRATELASLRAKVERSRGRVTWLVAGPTAPLDQTQPAPPPPQDFGVLAADGSHIDVDRHRPAHCYLINIGTARLHYGGTPEAHLESRPTLYAEEAELFIPDPRGAGREPVEGGLLAAKRSVEECQALLRAAQGLLPDPPTVALLDGSLILWGLGGEAYPEYVREELLHKGLLPALAEFEKLCQGHALALASYISLPRSTEVVNVLRVALCPHDVPDCDRYCPRGSSAATAACEAVAGVTDRELFGRVLRPGERSSSFVSGSSIVRRYYGRHEVRFFYLRLEDEVARVEFPRWVEEEGALDLVHALVLDGCRRGHGYPVALAEAHEQAVLSAADREAFQSLVEGALAERRLPTATSAKSRSKRTRWI